jgi:hypothetical protein
MGSSRCRHIAAASYIGYISRMVGPIEVVNAAEVRVGDVVATAPSAEWMRVVRITPGVVKREIDGVHEAFGFVTFEDGEEGGRVWTFRTTDSLWRRHGGSPI